MSSDRQLLCSNCKGDITNNLIEGRIFVKGKFVQFVLMCPHCRSVVRSLKPKAKEEDKDGKKALSSPSGNLSK